MGKPDCTEYEYVDFGRTKPGEQVIGIFTLTQTGEVGVQFAIGFTRKLSPDVARELVLILEDYFQAVAAQVQ
jgi:hypothetical protein